MKSIVWVGVLYVAALLTGDSMARQEQDNQEPVQKQKVTILAGSYFFKPERLTVKVNVPVELTISKESGIIPHSFVLEAGEAGMRINEQLESELKVIRFTPTKTGQFEFYCDEQLLFFPSHREKGMAGVLTVIK